jgi:inosine-uridine nucleoside N-ribohydrolase
MITKRSSVSRRQFLCQAAMLASIPLLARAASSVKPIPVILGTDIGDDIDDTWALGFLLRCPELEVKLVYGEYGKSQYRAKLIAKFLQTVGRADIPVAMGVDEAPHGDGPVAEWVRDYDLQRYPGKIHHDAVDAIIATIQQSSEPVTVISIAPAPNLAAAVRREPQIAARAHLAGMYGSLRLGYNGKAPASAEWNVRADVKACQTIFAAPWEKTITPLDTCGRIRLDGELYQRVVQSTDPIARTVLENYHIWARANSPNDKAPETHSSTLFDTVAIYLAFAQDFCQMETPTLSITDDGFTRMDPAGHLVHAATSWRDMEAFRKLLVDRLTGASSKT